jgi:hypothetical protein
VQERRSLARHRMSEATTAPLVHTMSLSSPPFSLLLIHTVKSLAPEIRHLQRESRSKTGFKTQCSSSNRDDQNASPISGQGSLRDPQIEHGRGFGSNCHGEARFFHSSSHLLSSCRLPSSRARRMSWRRTLAHRAVVTLLLSRAFHIPRLPRHDVEARTSSLPQLAGRSKRGARTELRFHVEEKRGREDNAVAVVAQSSQPQPPPSSTRTSSRSSPSKLEPPPVLGREMRQGAVRAGEGTIGEGWRPSDPTSQRRRRPPPCVRVIASTSSSGLSSLRTCRHTSGTPPRAPPP